MAKPKHDQNTYEVQLPNGRLYLDDVEEMVRVAKDGLGSVQLESETHEFECLDELPEYHKDTLNQFFLSAGSRPDGTYLRLRFLKEPFWVYSNVIVVDDGRNATARGVADQLLHVVQARQCIRFPAVGWWAFFYIIMGFVATVLFLEDIVPDTLRYVLVAVLLAYCVYFFAIRVVRKLRPPGVYPKFRSESQPNILRRNIDNLFVQVVAGGVLLILGFFLGLMSARAFG